jgi:hypothetical protein
MMTAEVVVDCVGRRPVTLSEALKLADEIMRTAEEGRIRAAEDEASRLFDSRAEAVQLDPWSLNNDC